MGGGSGGGSGGSSRSGTGCGEKILEEREEEIEARKNNEGEEEVAYEQKLSLSITVLLFNSCRHLRFCHGRYPTILFSSGCVGSLLHRGHFNKHQVLM